MARSIGTGIGHWISGCLLSGFCRNQDGLHRPESEPDWAPDRQDNDRRLLENEKTTAAGPGAPDPWLRTFPPQGEIWPRLAYIDENVSLLRNPKSGPEAVLNACHLQRVPFPNPAIDKGR